VPDARTVWLYRDALARAGKVEELFGLFDGNLARQGYIARGGQILDASIVPAPRNHNTRNKNTTIKRGEVCVFRSMRPLIPTTCAHLFRGIRPPVTRCREAACFGYQV